MFVYIQLDEPGKFDTVNSDDVIEVAEYEGEGICDIVLVGNKHMLVTDLEGYLIELGWKLAGREIDYE